MSSKFYTDPQFQTAYLLPLSFKALGTVAASTAGTSPTVLATAGQQNEIPPTFIRRAAINNLSVTTIVAPGVTPGTLGVLNGTNTVASIVVPAAGTNTVVLASTANNTFGAGAGPTFQFQGTASATTVSLGQYQVWFDAEELFN